MISSATRLCTAPERVREGGARQVRVWLAPERGRRPLALGSHQDIHGAVTLVQSMAGVRFRHWPAPTGRHAGRQAGSKPMEQVTGTVTGGAAEKGSTFMEKTMSWSAAAKSSAAPSGDMNSSCSRSILQSLS